MFNALLVLLVPVALATRVAATNLPCPLDGGPVQVFEKLSSDTLGGYDSDLVPYATKGQWRQYAVSTCPGNLLSLYGDDMAKPWPDELLKRMENALAVTAPTLSTRIAEDLPVWERYRVAAAVYEALMREPLFVANVYLEGSWTARDYAVGTTMALQGPGGARAALNAGELELKRELDSRSRKVLLHNLARIAARGGFTAERDRYIAAFQAVGALDKDERAAIERLRIGAAAEARMQDLAILALRKALLGTGLHADERGRATYLLGELLRRRGQPVEAQKRLHEAISLPGTNDQLRELATLLLGELSG